MASRLKYDYLEPHLPSPHLPSAAFASFAPHLPSPHLPSAAFVFTHLSPTQGVAALSVLLDFDSACVAVATVIVNAPANAAKVDNFFHLSLLEFDLEYIVRGISTSF